MAEQPTDNNPVTAALQQAARDAAVLMLGQSVHSKSTGREECAAIDALYAANPGKKCAVFLEKPPEFSEKDKVYTLQEIVNSYLQTGNENLLTGITLNKATLDRARKYNMPVFLIDDAGFHTAYGALLIKQKAALDSFIVDKEKIKPILLQEKQAFLANHLPMRNNVMSQRMISIFNGTNQEGYYKKLIPDGGFDAAVSINGSGHLCYAHDMDELVAEGTNRKIFTVELNAYLSDNDPPLVVAPFYYMVPPPGILGYPSEGPDLSININTNLPNISKPSGRVTP